MQPMQRPSGELLAPKWMSWQRPDLVQTFVTEKSTSLPPTQRANPPYVEPASLRQKPHRTTSQCA